MAFDDNRGVYWLVIGDQFKQHELHSMSLQRVAYAWDMICSACHLGCCRAHAYAHAVKKTINIFLYTLLCLHASHSGTRLNRKTCYVCAKSLAAILTLRTKSGRWSRRLARMRSSLVPSTLRTRRCSRCTTSNSSSRTFAPGPCPRPTCGVPAPTGCHRLWLNTPTTLRTPSCCCSHQRPPASLRSCSQRCSRQQ